jgi:hypothetical protein
MSITLLRRWHRMLGLSRQSPRSWYRDRLREELVERRAANTPLQKLSKTSDVFFSISRARCDGFPIRELPTGFTEDLSAKVAASHQAIASRKTGKKLTKEQESLLAKLVQENFFMKQGGKPRRRGRKPGVEIEYS